MNFFFGGESAHSNRMAKKANSLPSKFEVELTSAVDGIFETDGTRLEFPSEIDDQDVARATLKASILNYRDCIKQRIDDSSLDISYDESKEIAIATIGALTVVATVNYFDNLIEISDSAIHWTGAKIMQFVFPRYN